MSRVEELNSPEEIYGLALNHINQLVDLILQLEITEKKKEQLEINQQLIYIQKELSDQIKDLENNSEWEKFSIAFYGETNAGKSTIIETLRILFNEAKKVEERKLYAEKDREVNKVNGKLLENDKKITEIKDNYQNKITEIKGNLEHIIAERMRVAGEIETLKNIGIDDKIKKLQKESIEKRKSSIKNFFLWLFKKLDEQKEIKEFKKQNKKNRLKLKKLSSKMRKLNLSKDKYELDEQEVQKNFEKEIKKKNNLKQQLKNNIKKAEKEREAYCDGQIIGDGQSDFTKDTTTYELENNEENFTLLDLPGIEGNEEIVMKDITKSLKRSHAVFYVSSSATPPQNIESESEKNRNSESLGGTIRKIKEHLGDQTEVYYLFNKKIKNPIQLDGSELINSGEKAGLVEIDAIMKSVLGEQFKNCISLSAYPAFLTAANCMQRDRKSQKKFLQFFDYKKDLIMEKSYMKEFIDWLSEIFITNTKEKIKRANFKKVYDVIEQVAETLERQQHVIDNLKNDLIINKKNAEEQLKANVKWINNELDASLKKILSELEMNIRKEIYSKIDEHIDNDIFKSNFEVIMNIHINRLGRKVDKNFTDITNEFKDKTKKLIEKYNKTKEKFLQTYNSRYVIEDLKLDLNDDRDMKKLLISIGSSIAGVIVAIVTGGPAAWVVIALSIISGIITIGKTIIEFFSDNYRASRQKEKVDKKLSELKKEIQKQTDPKIAEIMTKVDNGVEKIKGIMESDIEKIEGIRKKFQNTSEDLNCLSYKIKSLVNE